MKEYFTGCSNSCGRCRWLPSRWRKVRQASDTEHEAGHGTGSLTQDRKTEPMPSQTTTPPQQQPNTQTPSTPTGQARRYP